MQSMADNQRRRWALIDVGIWRNRWMNLNCCSRGILLYPIKSATKYEALPPKCDKSDEGAFRLSLVY